MDIKQNKNSIGTGEQNNITTIMQTQGKTEKQTDIEGAINNVKESNER
jgi:hypothetical protein